MGGVWWKKEVEVLSKAELWRWSVVVTAMNGVDAIEETEKRFVHGKEALPDVRSPNEIYK